MFFLLAQVFFFVKKRKSVYAGSDERPEKKGENDKNYKFKTIYTDVDSTTGTLKERPLLLC